jgi:hypothetical protein
MADECAILEEQEHDAEFGKCCDRILKLAPHRGTERGGE